MPRFYPEDPRMAKTRGALVEALMDLVTETSWSAVTVAAVCRRARVHRSTFYAHYEDKADLLTRSFATFFDTLVDQGTANPRTGYLVLFRHCRQRAAFYRRALTSGTEFRGLLADYLEGHARDHGAAQGLDLGFATGGVIGMIEAFVAADPTPEPEVAAACLARKLQTIRQPL